jgi:hypothetical protein
MNYRNENVSSCRDTDESRWRVFRVRVGMFSGSSQSFGGIANAGGVYSYLHLPPCL